MLFSDFPSSLYSFVYDIEGKNSPRYRRNEASGTLGIVGKREKKVKSTEQEEVELWSKSNSLSIALSYIHHNCIPASHLLHSEQLTCQSHQNHFPGTQSVHPPLRTLQNFPTNHQREGPLVGSFVVCKKLASQNLKTICFS